ncbi:uncharacterized protein LOC108735674 [Agrilus planipennis]|uniref:Uncharacterized protein LOC108735674 n=1 Tax=Agrilus planipennis TaxID=224129 RepID=A0A1W4WT88_AGRPL|nr:uncharacterized protein LOC108735674 [Agrilus planipennis]
MPELKLLTDQQKHFYRENGYIKLDNVLSRQEIDEILETYDKLFQRKQRENEKGLEAAWGGDEVKKLSEGIKASVKSIHNLQMHNAVFTRLITHPKLLDALEDIMDTPDILLHHTKAHIKPPEKGAPFPMHQDYHYFPYKKHTMLAVFIHLDDTTPENGGLAVYPGSHKLGPLEDYGLKEDKTGKYHYVDPQKYPLTGATPVHAKKGEIVIFSYLLLHGSFLNLSTKTRRMFLLQVRAADDEPTRDTHKSPCQDLVLRGKNVSRDANIANRHEH